MQPRRSAAADLVATLQELAALADIRGTSAEAAELRAAASIIDGLEDADAAQLLKDARRDRLDRPDISPTLNWRIREIAEGGGHVARRAARAGLPAVLRRLLELPAITSEEALILVRQLNVLTLADLELALDDGRLARAVGAKTATRLSSGIHALSLEWPLLPLGRAVDLVGAILASISRSGAPLDRLQAAGDVRRFESLVRDIVIVASSPNPPSALEIICRATPVDDVLHRGARRAVLRHQNGEIDLRVTAPDEYGTVLFAATGSREHIQAVSRRRGRPGICSREEDVYRQAGLVWIPPELRHASGELEAAADGALPELIERAHIRGDLHTHSTYSDGRDSLEDMVAAAIALGYEYMAITDHSQRSAASRNLMLDEIAPQREEVARLRERYPQIQILHGVEVDIMPDGTLDFDDDVLAGFDIVLASLHDAAGQDGPRLTERCLRAIRHPLVNAITHPANRLVGRRDGYPLDYDAVYAAAAEAGTALEIDGAPTHLDLDGEHARAAVAAGVTVVIDSDCHRASWLERQMSLGIGTARRGWVEPRHVLNARPLDAVRAFIAAKRRGC